MDDAPDEVRDEPELAAEGLKAQLDSLDPERLDRLSGTLRHLIDHMARRIEYAESRRASFATLAGALVAAGVAILAIVNNMGASPVRLALTLLAVGLLATASLVLIVWAQQTNPNYSFIREDTKFQRPWKWFYRDALLRDGDFDFKWMRRSEAKIHLKGKEAFDSQWAPFVERQFKLADPVEDVIQDFRQVYLLHVNERYKNLFLKQVRRVLVRGFLASILAALITLAVAAFLEERGSLPSNDVSPTPTAVGSSTPAGAWRPIRLSLDYGS
jgi:hypothetical protein